SLSNYENGIPHGVQMQWYSNGAKFKRINLVYGKEEGLQQSWRKNGKLYNNYEAKNGRIFGLKRANLCFQLDNENITYED
ncbi:MAG: toxin-antitoxin system YwqK family antitoxin, partial [Bacteroidetes bacterium]